MTRRNAAILLLVNLAVPAWSSASAAADAIVPADRPNLLAEVRSAEPGPVAVGSADVDWTVDGVNLTRMVDPRVLPCGHSFDRTSLEGWVARRKSALLPPDCPLCRTEFDSIPPACLALRAALDWQKAHSAPGSPARSPMRRKRKLPKLRREMPAAPAPADLPMVATQVPRTSSARPFRKADFRAELLESDARFSAAKNRREREHRSPRRQTRVQTTEDRGPQREYQEPFSRQERLRIGDQKYIEKMIRYLNHARPAYRPFSGSLDGRSYVEFQGTWFEVQYEVHYGAILDDISGAWVAPPAVALRLEEIHGS